RMHHAYELLEHLFGDSKVGNDTVFHWPNGFNVARDAAQHLLGLTPYRLNYFLAVRAAFMANGNHRRLVQHNTLAANIDKSIGGTEIDCHIGGEITTQESEHGRSVKSELIKIINSEEFFHR